MDFCFNLDHFVLKLTLMPIMLAVRLIAGPLMVTAFILVIAQFRGVLRNKLPYCAPAQKLNTVNWHLLQLKYLGCLLSSKTFAFSLRMLPLFWCDNIRSISLACNPSSMLALNMLRSAITMFVRKLLTRNSLSVYLYGRPSCRRIYQRSHKCEI